MATVPLEPIGKQLERWVIAALLFASSASAALGLGCGTTPPLGRVIGREDVEGETAVAAIYRFAHRNDICVGLALDDNALLPPLARTHFQNTSVSAVLRKLLPRSYRAREQGRVVLIEPVKGAPAWLSQQIDRFRLQRPEPVRMTVHETLYMHYEMARNPQRRTGFAGSVLGSDFSNRIGPLDERHKTVRELLNIIAERSRGGMWVGLHGPQWEFIEYQRPEDQGASMLRWITNLAR